MYENEEKSFILLPTRNTDFRRGIAVKLQVSHAECLRFESDSRPWPNAHSLFTQ